MTDLVSQTFFARYPWPSWVLVGLFLVFLLVMAFAVKNEKNTFLRYKKDCSLQELHFFVPPWWAVKNAEANSLSFERQDTFYEWEATIEKKSLQSVEDFFIEGTFSPRAVLEKILQDWEIKIDPEDWASLSDSHALFGEETRQRIKKVLRIEGRGLHQGEHRVYLDTVLIFLKTPDQEQAQEEKGTEFFFYQLTSRSSVLNGFVEGPYFEEVLKHLKIK